MIQIIPMNRVNNDLPGEAKVFHSLNCWIIDLVCVIILRDITIIIIWELRDLTLGLSLNRGALIKYVVNIDDIDVPLDFFWVKIWVFTLLSTFSISFRIVRLIFFHPWMIEDLRNRESSTWLHHQQLLNQIFRIFWYLRVKCILSFLDQNIEIFHIFCFKRNSPLQHSI